MPRLNSTVTLGPPAVRMTRSVTFLGLTPLPFEAPAFGLMSTFRTASTVSARESPSARTQAATSG